MARRSVALPRGRVVTLGGRALFGFRARRFNAAPRSPPGLQRRVEARLGRPVRLVRLSRLAQAVVLAPRLELLWEDAGGLRGRCVEELQEVEDDDLLRALCRLCVASGFALVRMYLLPPGSVDCFAKLRLHGALELFRWPGRRFPGEDVVVTRDGSIRRGEGAAPLLCEVLSLLRREPPARAGLRVVGYDLPCERPERHFVGVLRIA